MSSLDVIQFWFGDLDARGVADDAHRKRWFMRDATFDEEIRTRFGSLHAEIANGGHREWLTDDWGRVATVVVLDQFSRNLFRGSPISFAQDAQALAVARESVDLGVDRRVGHDARAFFYMPFMHSEDPADQARALELFTGWREEEVAPLQERVDGGIRFARMHKDIVDRFGRFPHRNATLGRTSTDEEVAFLAQPGSGF